MITMTYSRTQLTTAVAHAYHCFAGTRLAHKTPAAFEKHLLNEVNKRICDEFCRPHEGRSLQRLSGVPRAVLLDGANHMFCVGEVLVTMIATSDRNLTIGFWVNPATDVLVAMHGIQEEKLK